MTNFSASLGSMLRNLRLSKGFTQTFVASHLKVTRSAYAVYESGRSLPDLESLRVLAKLFSVSPQAFFYPENHIPIPLTNQRASRKHSH